MNSNSLFLFFLIFSQFLYSCESKVDQIDITGFGQCGLTTKWFKKQFSPFLSAFSPIPENLNITYHPLSIGSKKVNGSKIAICENGYLECELDKLQCCSKKYIKNQIPDVLLKVLACIQGQKLLENGLKCLPEEENELIQKCADSQEGEELLLAEPFPHNDSISLPWIKINGVRSWEATQNFQKIVCNLESAKTAPACKNK